jgi:hypothetical protein
VVEAVAAEMNGDSDARPEAAFASPLDTFVEEPVAEEYAPIAEEPAIEEAAPDGAIFAETGLEEWGFEDAGFEETAIEEWGVGASDIEDSPVEETAIAADAILADDIVSNPIAATSEEEVGVTEGEEAVAYTAPSIAHHLLIPQDDEIAALRAEIADLRTRISEPVVPAAPNIDPEALKDCLTIIDERLNGIETRALEQDVALRRVLALLVDWVEQEDRMLDPQQDVA